MCLSPQPEWIALLSALLTPVLAATAAYIAWQQWRTNRNKLKLELFERRFAMYDAAVQLINSILGAGKVEDQPLRSFVTRTRSAAFIVGQPIEAYLNKELYARAVKLQMLEAELQGLTGEDRIKNVREQSEAKQWLVEQYAVLERLFRRQLMLEH